MSRPQKPSHPQPVTVTATPEEATAFLDNLIDNKKFRERYEADPHAVLAQYGVFVPRDMVKGAVKAPPPEALIAVRDALKKSGGTVEMWCFVFFGFRHRRK
jgi:hypothetical protein